MLGSHSLSNSEQQRASRHPLPARVCRHRNQNILDQRLAALVEIGSENHSIKMFRRPVSKIERKASVHQACGMRTEDHPDDAYEEIHKDTVSSHIHPRDVVSPNHEISTSIHPHHPRESALPRREEFRTDRRLWSIRRDSGRCVQRTAGGSKRAMIGPT